MPSISKQADGLYVGERRLGPLAALYAYPGELRTLGEADGVIRVKLPENIDYAFAAGEYVVTAESKRPGDLVSSVFNSKLSRQLQAVCALGTLPLLVLRGGVPPFGEPDTKRVLHELVKWQMAGVILLPTPSSDRGVYEQLLYVRRLAEAGPIGLRQMLAGNEPLPSDRRTLLRAIKWIGPTRERALLAAFGTPGAVLAATVEELKDRGVSQSIIKAIQVAKEAKRL